MRTETLTQKEKELIAVGTAVSAGCQRCCNYHFKKVFEVGATLDEVKASIMNATNVIALADEMMQRKAYALMEVTREEVEVNNTEQLDRMDALVRIGAAVASNCTPTIELQIEAAKAALLNHDEMIVAIKLGKMILRKAGEFADEAISESLASAEEKEIQTG